MKLNHFKTILLITPIIFASLFLSSCGENVFAKKDPPVTIETASTPAEFQQIITSAETVITNPSSTDTEKQVAYIEKATATLGLHGVSILDFADALTDFSEEDAPSDQAQNLFNLISLDATEEELLLIADAFNIGNAYSDHVVGTSSLSQVQSTTENLSAAIKTILASSDCPSGNLSDSETLNTLISNLYVIVNKVQDVFEISADGSITPLVSSSWIALTRSLAIVTSDLDPDTVRSITYYAGRGICAVNDLDNVFTAQQIADIGKIRTVANDLEALKTAVLAGTSFNLSITVSPSQLSQAYEAEATMSSADDTILNDTLDSIFAILSD